MSTSQPSEIGNIRSATQPLPGQLREVPIPIHGSTWPLLRAASSLPMLVQALEAAEIKIKTPSPAKLGSNRRLPLSVVVTTPEGHTVKNPAVEWRTSNRFIVSIGQDGVAVGGEIGDAQVTASAGVVVSNSLEIEVEKGAAGRPKGGGK